MQQQLSSLAAASSCCLLLPAQPSVGWCIPIHASCTRIPTTHTCLGVGSILLPLQQGQTQQHHALLPSLSLSACMFVLSVLSAHTVC